MSRFLFREWDPENKRMRKRVRGGIKGLVNNIVMQSTGIEDMNDTLIYEQDIVRFQYKDSEGNEILDIGYISWFPSQAAFTVITHCGQYVLSTHIRNMQVMGNMYENSELFSSSVRSVLSDGGVILEGELDDDKQ